MDSSNFTVQDLKDDTGLKKVLDDLEQYFFELDLAYAFYELEQSRIGETVLSPLEWIEQVYETQRR
jgi:hypothetical protein